MAQGEFTRQETEATREAVEEMFHAIPKTRRMGHLGHLNDILLFLNATARHAPDENKKTNYAPTPTQPRAN